MNHRVIWRSWSKGEAAFELERLKDLPFTHQWVDGHLVQPQPDDIYLTTNGYDHREGPFKKATLYAESYQYLKTEYDRYESDKRWNHRFHFNPYYTRQAHTSYQQIACWWKREVALFEKTIKAKQPTHVFGMVLSKKPSKQYSYEFGWFRQEVVDRSKGRSFRYHGSGWDPRDSNYLGETYVAGHRGSPIKFHDARVLLAKVKFVWCLENIHDPVFSQNYLTEKIFHGFLSASIPIYCGCWNAADLISPDLFIDLRDFNYDATKAMDYCEKMPESEYRGYLERIGKFLAGPGQAFTCEERFKELDQKLQTVFD